MEGGGEGCGVLVGRRGRAPCCLFVFKQELVGLWLDFFTWLRGNRSLRVIFFSVRRKGWGAITLRWNRGRKIIYLLVFLSVKQPKGFPKVSV